MIALGGPTLKLMNETNVTDGGYRLNDSTGRAYTETEGSYAVKFIRGSLNDSTGRAYTETRAYPRTGQRLIRSQ